MPEVSVIIPTCNRYKTLIENINNIRKQTYPSEIIVCDDSHISDCEANKELVDEVCGLADKYYYTALYDQNKNKLYGLGRARNKGVIESSCVYVCFLDDRISPEKDNMLESFLMTLKRLGGKKWVFGDKGAHKMSFVENCSAAKRQDLITSGMFCESINSYGFMTRELLSRYLRQGWEFVYVPEALAKPICTGSRRNDPERQKQIDYSRSILEKMKLV